MRKLIALQLLVVLCGCGKPAVSVRSASQAITSGASSGGTAATPLPPEMDALACPSDMALVPATLGHSAICIDLTPHAASAHLTASNACSVAGKTLCSGAQYAQAAGSLSAGYYWALETSWTGASMNAFAYNLNGTGGFITSTNSYVSLCCSR